jgi:hypothetical protein
MLLGAFLPMMTFSAIVRAQTDERDATISNLPRPGYEPRKLLLGSAVITPDISLLTRYDDNVFASPNDRRSDVVFDLRSDVALHRAAQGSTVNAAAYAATRRYVHYDRENVTTFGVRASGSNRLGARGAVSARTSFDRLFERRSDPEAIVDPSRRPSLLDRIEAAIDVRSEGARFDLSANVTVVGLNYRRVQDDDRDLAIYQTSLRAGWRLREGMSLYVQPYANRRNARLERDRGGVDRDATTTGVLAGVSLGLADRLVGDVGVGAFHADPDDGELRSFDGLAFSGRLSWQPRVRTSVRLQGFRGDVATIRAGAIGRVDTRASLIVEQEAHHDVIVKATIGLRNVHYRGTIDRDQRYLTVGAGARYLLNRTVALTLDGDWTKRGADFAPERFRRWQTSVGLILTY